jgi:ATP-dependent RNA helicase DeaD
MTKKTFAELGLSPELLKAIDKLGFEQPAPIQAAAIPPLLEGKDVVGQSQTGSGKTVAFAAPAIQKVDVNVAATQVLILCPTRELAVQVSEEVHKLALFKRGLRSLPIYGGQSYDRQFFGLKQGVHIVIGTPGRIMDHMRRGTMRLDSVKMVVLDEVDVMLNMGFREDIDFILQAAPTERQTVFFSATIPKPIQQLIEKHSHNPESVKMEQKALTVPTVEQLYYEVDRRFKVELLTRLIDIHDLRLGIIFCNTRRMVDDLVEHLNAQGYSADRLHGEMTQAMRDRVMNRFRKSALEFLVATDVAARGIDVENIEVVFNYDLPYDGEDYVHRIGRTGRQGRSGRAISFASGREVFQIRNIERYTNMRIHRGQVPTVGEVEEARTNAVLERVRDTLKRGEFKRQDQLLERLLEEGYSSTDIASALLHHLQGGEAQGGKPVVEEQPRDFGESRRPERTSRGSQRSGPMEQDTRREYQERREPRVYQDRRESSRPQRSTARQEARPSARPAHTAKPTHAPSKPLTPAVSSPPTPEPTPKSPPAPAFMPKPPKPSAAPEPPKASRRTPKGQMRLHMNVGAEMGVSPEDVVSTISGLTGLPRDVVGTVDLRERHLFVDVSAEHASSIVPKLNRALIKGTKVKAKMTQASANVTEEKL